MARENIVKTLAQFFVIKIRQYDDHNYSYFADVEYWEDHLKAYESMVEINRSGSDAYCIWLRHLDVLNNGKIVSHDIKAVWADGIWASAEHDPRASDPKFREYLRLKEIYEPETKTP